MNPHRFPHQIEKRFQSEWFGKRRAHSAVRRGKNYRRDVGQTGNLESIVHNGQRKPAGMGLTLFRGFRGGGHRQRRKAVLFQHRGDQISNGRVRVSYQYEWGAIFQSTRLANSTVRGNTVGTVFRTSSRGRRPVA